MAATRLVVVLTSTALSPPASVPEPLTVLSVRPLISLYTLPETVLKKFNVAVPVLADSLRITSLATKGMVMVPLPVNDGSMVITCVGLPIASVGTITPPPGNVALV